MVNRSINTKILEDYMEKNNLTIQDFCNKCRITPYFYSQMLLGDPTMNCYDLFKVAKIVGVKVSDMLE